MIMKKNNIKHRSESIIITILKITFFDKKNHLGTYILVYVTR